jgi:hypothetical protein
MIYLTKDQGKSLQGSSDEETSLNSISWFERNITLWLCQNSY